MKIIRRKLDTVICGSRGLKTGPITDGEHARDVFDEMRKTKPPPKEIEVSKFLHQVSKPKERRPTVEFFQKFHEGKINWNDWSFEKGTKIIRILLTQCCRVSYAGSP